MIATLLCLLFLFAFFEAPEVILDEESGVELANRHVVVACRHQIVRKNKGSCQAYIVYVFTVNTVLFAALDAK